MIGILGKLVPGSCACGTGTVAGNWSSRKIYFAFFVLCLRIVQYSSTRLRTLEHLIFALLKPPPGLDRRQECVFSSPVQYSTPQSIEFTPSPRSFQASPGRLIYRSPITLPKPVEGVDSAGASLDCKCDTCIIKVLCHKSVNDFVQLCPNPQAIRLT